MEILKLLKAVDVGSNRFRLNLIASGVTLCRNSRPTAWFANEIDRPAQLLQRPQRHVQQTKRNVQLSAVTATLSAVK